MPKTPKKPAVDLETEVIELRAKLRKARAEIRVLKAAGKGSTKKEGESLKIKLEKIFNQGYQEAVKDINKVEDAFKKYMNKASDEFDKKILPKLKKVVGSKGKKSKPRKVIRKKTQAK